MICCFRYLSCKDWKLYFLWDQLFIFCHLLDIKERKNDVEYGKPLTVGENVWIGGNCCILPGVTIGDNTVIGAGSIVTKDIPANVVAVVNPYKIICE